MKNKFWNVKTDGKKSRVDLFGYVGGSKEWNNGFNEKEFLDEFRAIPDDNEIDISINSFGGSVYTGLSIYSLLKAHKGQITFRVDGAAMSAATIITSVPNAKVIMPRGSMMMIHKVSSFAIGNTDDLRKVADDMEKLEENIIDIYVQKTGKSADEIREKVNAESYFTAQEAVDFGLADEVDESIEVENKACGDFIMLNGLKVQAKLFEHAPEGFIKADKPQVSAVKNPEKTEVKTMDLEKLKAEYPELVESIRIEAMKEGAEKERARIKAIEEVAMAGHEDLVNTAKFDGVTTAEALAVQMIKAEKAKAKNMLEDIKHDAEDLKDIQDKGNTGLVDQKDETQQIARNRLAEACKFKGGN